MSPFCSENLDEKTQKPRRSQCASCSLCNAHVIDTAGWHTSGNDYLKTVLVFGFGQRDPLVEYKTEAYEAFTLAGGARKRTKTRCA